MPINSAALQRKLDAILGKDAADIVAQGVYIPWLNAGYTVADLQAWLAKRSDLLVDVKLKQYSDAQLETLYSNTYNSLGVNDRALVDAAISGQPADLSQASSASAYDKIVVLILYHFVTDPNA